MADQPERDARAMSPGDEFRADCIEALRGLTDIRLQTILTTRMAPAINVFLCGGVLALNLVLTVGAFERSLVSGLVWLLLMLPVGTLAGVVLVRVVLESLLTLFRIGLRMETLLSQLHLVRGQTESIAGRVEDLPLPRIQFWRPRRRNMDDAP